MNGWTVGAWVVLAGCPQQPEPEPPACDDTWESFAHGYTITWCRSCHSASLTTPESRYGAPAGVDFDTLASIRGWEPRVEGALERMPPAGGVPEDVRARFDVWVRCGMPGEGTVVAPTCADAVERPGDVAIATPADAAALCADGPITVGGALRVDADAVLGCVCAVGGGVTVGAGTAEVPALDAIGGALTIEPGAVGLVAPALHTLGGGLTADGAAALTRLEVGALRTVGGDVVVTDAPALAEFLPEQLVAVPGSFRVERTGIDAVDLSRIETVDGDLRVVDNPQMVDLRGEGYALTQVAGDLVLSGLPSLTRTFGDELGTFYGFGYLESVGGDLRIEDSDGFTVIRGFNYLTNVGGTVSVSGNDGLVGLDGFDQLRNIGGDLTIVDNTALLGNDGFDAVEVVGGELRISGSPALSVLGSLTLVEQVGALTVDGLPVLLNAGAWPNLRQVHGDLRFVGLPAVTTLDGFFQLDEVGGALVFDAMPALTLLNVRATQLTEVGGDVRVRGVGLGALDLPDALIAIGGGLYVDDDPSLTDVTGLFTLTSVAGDVHVTGNTALPAAAAAALATEIESIGGAVTIEENGP